MKEETKQKDSRENILYLAWIAAVLSMFGSLYFSEIRDFIPCTLCWYQRILMYPFVIILGIAVIRKDYKISFYTMILSGIGACISIYHYSIQKLASIFETSSACGPVSCTGEYINWLGFITIPFMALIGFIIIFTCSIIIWKKTKEMNQ
ncbi:disulfide bond formation protein B [Niallia circulans]|jgi:disulfide bond formation protein DsbB|uniref:disulfide oxidoreductase n=1 Tax=Niallia TaxID=2837506 RepID=UPI000BA6323E|nr:disulfide oxidoreductase [Niallia circulans]MCM2982524.1 disulfide oxidoreductase [Niallia circulans]NRG30474.1 disulfide bond formation protein B [Niallia circulans]PAD25066.1 disulfide bond formation protein B [Niallia circulans]PAD89057.1 disulfide bond formation protein B [Niallia circulans]PAE13581.1 disulfide bond formation protein B [Niallia circulans]